MQVLPIDLTAVVAVILGSLMFLIPIAGITARFALKPLVDSMARFFDTRTMEDAMAINERRVALLESQVESLEHTVDQLRAAHSFDRELGRGSEPERLPSGE
jgi:hypothetical protein